MKTPSDDRQEWLDFSHTVDVLTSSALAASDLAQPPAANEPGRAAGMAGMVGNSVARVGKRRALAGILMAACLLLIAVPVSRVLNPEWFGGAPVVPLDITLAKTSYRPGEPLLLTLQSSQDCHPLVYSIADNQVKLFDPAGSGAGAASVKADDPLQGPAPSARSAAAPDLAATTPGRYTVGALCSGSSLTALGTSETELREKAQQGRSSFESYLSGLADRDQRAVTKKTYDVQ